MLDASLNPKNMQRAEGRAEVGFGATGLTHLFQSGCGKALLPRSPQTPQAVFINTSGGVTGGDRLHYAASVEGGARLRAWLK